MKDAPVCREEKHAGIGVNRVVLYISGEVLSTAVRPSLFLFGICDVPFLTKDPYSVVTPYILLSPPS
jgi:hypothetical protein